MAWSGGRPPRLLLPLLLAVAPLAVAERRPGSGPAGEPRGGVGAWGRGGRAPRLRRPGQLRLGAAWVAAAGMRCRPVPFPLCPPAR